VVPIRSGGRSYRRSIFVKAVNIVGITRTNAAKSISSRFEGSNMFFPSRGTSGKKAAHTHISGPGTLLIGKPQSGLYPFSPPRGEGRGNGSQVRFEK